MSTPLNPERERDLAESLAAYTDPSNEEYDPVLTARLREIRPDWFEDESEGTADGPGETGDDRD